ncbi:MAG TPA: isopentenyl transferase family protein [Roseiflexaceae bacterium]|nr:isopentenyl transferase family protein [Roseiflexaceae bacterium]
MQIHLILGPTGVGKTAHATRLAYSQNEPVIVLDRIQAYPELSVGSGRPGASEYAGTERLYLAERRVAEGDFLVRDALDALHTLLRRNGRVIVEGGSISLLHALFATSWFQRASVTYDVLSLPDLAYYQERVTRRIGAMLDEGMVDELQHAWSQGAQARAFVQTVIGYDVLLDVCCEQMLSPARLAEVLRSDVGLRSRTVRRIFQRHLRYAIHQQSMIDHHLSPAVLAPVELAQRSVAM